MSYYYLKQPHCSSIDITWNAQLKNMISENKQKWSYLFWQMNSSYIDDFFCDVFKACCFLLETDLFFFIVEVFGF